jgi:hypothetical protein
LPHSRIVIWYKNVQGEANYYAKKIKFFLITVLVVSFALIISLADLFSSFLTIGNFAFLPSQGVKISS